MLKWERRSKFLCLCSVLVFLGSGSSSAFAQAPLTSELVDAEKAFQIAQSASASGDFQTAIIALERILVISPGLANIQFELGILYKRVGAPRRAEYFFREALKSDEMPPEIRKRANDELAELSTTQNSGVFGLNLGVRLRNESNPGADSETADFFDPVSQGYVTGTSIDSGEAETSLQLNVNTNYRKRFGKSAQHLWTVGAGLSTSKYFSDSTYDESSLTLNGSTVFALQSSSPSVDDRAGPFVYYTVGFDGSDVEDSTVGAGLRFSKSSKNWSTSASLQANSKSYDDPIVAQTSDETGTRFGLNFRFRASESSKLTLGVAINHSNVNSETESQSYSGTDLNLSAIYPISAISGAPRSAVTVSLGQGNRDYDALNLVISDSQVREDDRPQFGVSINVPFTNGFSVNAGVRVLDNRSSLPNYRYTNTTTHVGFNWRY